MKNSKKFLIILIILIFIGSGVGIFFDLYPRFHRDVSGAQAIVNDYARRHHISPDQYPKSLVALLDRNPETRDFVLNYPFREEITPDLSGYSRSTVPLFLQWDPAWGYKTYGSDMIAITGCGPTSLAMAGYYLTGNPFFTPDQVAAFAEENGYYSWGNGSSWTLISEGAVQLGLDVTEIPLVEQRVVDNLMVGNPIICAMGPGDFTEQGHYIVLSGYEDGLIRVNDPNSPKRSEKLWSFQELSSQIRNLWVIR